MKIRNVAALNSINDAKHSRSFLDSIMLPAVISAVQDWASAGGGGVLVGGGALSFHARPRLTQELDFLFVDTAPIPGKVSGFDRISAGLFRHRRTHVAVNLVTPAAIRVPMEVAEEIARTAMLS